MKQILNNQASNLANKKFGKLTALYQEESIKTSGGHSQVMWRCRCDCGNYISVRATNLRSGGTSSCGCIKHPDLTGKRFGKLVVLEKADVKNNLRHWKCKCDCGNITIVGASQLVGNRTKNCGCLRKVCHTKTHGLTKTRLHRIWSGIKNRCYNSKDKHYKYYGKRGILMCDEWKNDFMTFRKWALENGYEENLSIDRIDVNGNYEPPNCRWATNKTQQNNKTDNVKIEYNGETHTVAEWSEQLGICYETLYSRLSYGWTTEEVLFGKK